MTDIFNKKEKRGENGGGLGITRERRRKQSNTNVTVWNRGIFHSAETSEW